MIKLTKTDNSVIAVNENFIENIAQTPDTFIALTSGKTLVVKESIDEIIELVESFHRRCHPVSCQRKAKASESGK